MRWPWTSSGTDDNAKSSKDKTVSSVIPSSISDISLEHFRDPRNFIPAIALTGASLLGVRFYKSKLRRIPNIEHIRPQEYRHRKLLGKVTSVGDGDNFRIFHTPGGRLAGWGWLPGRRVPTRRDELSNNTIHIRIAGIDAPELAHFGRPAQPYGSEALAWLTAYIGRRRVRAHLWRRDQYDRVVATVFVRRWLLKRDVGLEMLKNGYATVYEAKTGSEFGQFEQDYRRAEETAKRAKRGMWNQPGVIGRLFGEKKTSEESPRQFKDRMAATAKETEGNGKSKGKA